MARVRPQCAIAYTVIAAKKQLAMKSRATRLTNLRRVTLPIVNDVAQLHFMSYNALLKILFIQKDS